MQLELIGCTGAGKSTLAARIVDAARAEGIKLVLADEFALNQLGLRHLRTRWLRAVAVHVVAFWGCISRGSRHVRFIEYAYRVLHYSKIPRRQQWNQLRKVLKQLGRYEVIRCRRQSQTPVLVDEGTLHAAHNLFVHVANDFNNDHVRQFAERVPLPDIVIYVREREDVLIERTLDRRHPRIADPTPQSVAKFVRQAVLVFDQLSKHERVAPRTLVIQDGVIVSEPNELGNPELKNVMKVLRGAIATGTLPTNNLDCDSTLVDSSGAA